MSNSAIPASLCDLLAKLEYLALIQRNQKPCFSDLSMVDSESYTGAYKRFKHNESRKIMIYQVNQIIDSALEAVNEFSESEFLILILNSLSKAKIGISNLQFTYHEDTNIVSQIRVCLDKINNRLDKYRNILIKRINVDEEKRDVREEKREFREEKINGREEKVGRNDMSKKEESISKNEERKEKRDKKDERKGDGNQTGVMNQVSDGKGYDSQYPPFLTMNKSKKGPE